MFFGNFLINSCAKRVISKATKRKKEGGKEGEERKKRQRFRERGQMGQIGEEGRRGGGGRGNLLVRQESDRKGESGDVGIG